MIVKFFTLDTFSYLYSQTSHFHANNISLFCHWCSNFILYLSILAIECSLNVCCICLIPDRFHPIFLLMNWISSIICLLWLAIHICFSYESASMIRILHTSTFYQLFEQQWLKYLSIWVCLLMFWMIGFLLRYPTWSILPIIKKILKLSSIFELQPRRVSWRANSLSREYHIWMLLLPVK